ncbi:hypothetical protein SNEBB_007483 [Seison nebaliae]|nr:hypothetical protein SNEBB_007483 [Seison nebaliae]
MIANETHEKFDYPIKLSFYLSYLSLKSFKHLRFKRNVNWTDVQFLNKTAHEQMRPTKHQSKNYRWLLYFFCMITIPIIVLVGEKIIMHIGPCSGKALKTPCNLMMHCVPFGLKDAEINLPVFTGKPICTSSRCDDRTTSTDTTSTTTTTMRTNSTNSTSTSINQPDHVRFPCNLLIPCIRQKKKKKIHNSNSNLPVFARKPRHYWTPNQSAIKIPSLHLRDDSSDDSTSSSLGTSTDERQCKLLFDCSPILSKKTSTNSDLPVLIIQAKYSQNNFVGTEEAGSTNTVNSITSIDTSRLSSSTSSDKLAFNRV